MKTRPLVILLLMLLTQAIFAEEKHALSPICEANSKISWSEIFPMLNPKVAQEIGKTIEAKLEKSFNEGYKSATIQFAPQLEYWKTAAESSERRFWSGFFYGAGTAGLSALVITTIALISPKEAR